MTEHNRGMILIVSLSLFLALSVGLGAWLLYPRGTDGMLATQTAAGTSGGFDPIRFLRDNDSTPPSLIPDVDAPDSPMAETPGERSADQFALERPALVPDIQVVPDSAPQPARELGNGVTQTGTEVSRSSSASDGTQASRSPSAGVQTRTGSEASTPATSVPDSAATVPDSPSTTTSVPARTVPARTQSTNASSSVVTEYWIQLISSPSRDTIDLAQEYLQNEYALGSRVTSRIIDGTTYYRLRVGPYLDYRESVRFRDTIREIDDFSAAYISEEYRTQ